MQPIQCDLEPLSGGGPGISGTVPSWGALYDRLGPEIFCFLYRRTGTRDLAADLTHDVFVRVFDKLPGFDGRGPIDAWVYRIAANVARDRWKRPRLFSSYEEVSHPDGKTDDPRAEASAHLRLAMARFLTRLPRTQRLVVLLHDVDGFTHEEISRLLGIAVGTSKARVSRARARLRATLRDER